MRWRQAAGGTGFRAGRVCAPCSAPSIGWIKQAREVAVLVVDELEHIWGKERWYEQQWGRGSIYLHTLVHTAVHVQAMLPI